MFALSFLAETQDVKIRTEKVQPALGFQQNNCGQRDDRELSRTEGKSGAGEAQRIVGRGSARIMRR